MKTYIIKAKIPRNQAVYLSYLKRSILDICEERDTECVVEFLDGRVLLFTSSVDVLNGIKGLKGVISVHDTTVFDDYSKVLNYISRCLEGKKTFAIRSNKKELEKKMGADIISRTGLKVNLTSPDIVVKVEKRGKYYLVYL